MIDHSALNEGGTAEEKQFLVMLIAKEGDLSRPERLSYYKGSMEVVLRVAKSAACIINIVGHSLRKGQENGLPRMAEIEGELIALWVAKRDIHHCDDPPPPQRLQCSAMLDQNIGIGRMAARKTCCHKSEVRKKGGCAIDFAEDGFSNRR